MNTAESNSSTKHSIRRHIMWRGALRSLVVALVLALVSYYHAISLLEGETRAQLQQYIIERGKLDSAPFNQTELYHQAIEKVLLEQLNKVPIKQGVAQFDQYFEQWPDKTWRTKQPWYDGKVAADGLYHEGFTAFIGHDVQLTDEYRHRTAVMVGLLDWYGSALIATEQYINYYLSTPENFLVGEFVGVPYMHQVPSDTYFPDEVFVALADARNNPSRQLVWSEVYFDSTAKMWMVSCLKPVYRAGEHIATLGQDILLDDFINRTLKKAQQGTENLAFNSRGELIAYGALQEQILAAGGALVLGNDQPQIRNLVLKVIKQGQSSGVVEIADAYVAFTHLQGPDWYLANIYPKHLLQDKALLAASVIFAIALLGLLSEFAVLWHLITRYVLQPLQHFTRVSRAVDHGDFRALQESDMLKRDDEFGLLARHLQGTAQALLKAQDAVVDSHEELERLVTVRTAELTSVNERLARLAITDELSGLFNRRHFQQKLPLELARLARHNNRQIWAVFALLDVDHFKQINDRYGHSSGDCVIRKLGASLHGQMRRAGDSAYRIGGEEFAVYTTLVEPNVELIQELATQMLDSIRSIELHEEISHFEGPLTASIGMVCLPSGHEPLQLDHLYKLADQALYQAKNAGRNQAHLIVQRAAEQLEHYSVN
ncbi:sigma-B regulation protein RsbU (phosphoserine phosphatase) [Atopomonas hussainii]|uniref:diguanylate cyclase n=1 Tax=Atopomonas hussainii TaxID=1429083 RepID=A0A1H7FPM1_9GAMM|nr:sensor domain-containing diguanylate cyclase [Atopomonas hussainii]SEK26422.1 sigma-B regulation protein RsbU (phosphoserine phosphatase) [Atopomonas hussainii]